jgi:hypothetical protein
VKVSSTIHFLLCDFGFFSLFAMYFSTNLQEEENNLKILFYEAKFHQAFGSIFPSVDICNLVPEGEADVAILEEPEHLNWLRLPEPNGKERVRENGNSTQEEKKVDNSQSKQPVTGKEKAELGWRFKFRHVVGIIHTNYRAYLEQYGMGAKFITVPALCALNSLVISAYTHKVILLSGAVPSAVPYKEVTCNVHGVRAEFLHEPVMISNDNDESYSPVYFVGKIMWAKGFDKVLDLQNLYREKHNEYFPMDIYGSGSDEKAIKRAFFGRIPQIQPKEAEEEKESAPNPETAEVFTWESSLRSHLVDNAPFKDNEKHRCLDESVAKRRASAGAILNGRSSLRDEQLAASEEGNNEKPRKRKSVAHLADLSGKIAPISVLGDLSKNAFETTKATSGAAVAVAKNVVTAGLNVTFAKGNSSSPLIAQKTTTRDESSSNDTDDTRKQLVFEPPQSVFEFRRYPIPARFRGSKDHVLIRDIPAHKIFLNMSITEVLCTTSAEALAMGKFVILPKHRK